MTHTFGSFWLLLVLWLSFFTVPALGQTAGGTARPRPLSMSVTSPLALTEQPLSLQVRKGRWFPVAVTFTNTGEPVRGTLTLKTASAVESDRNATQYFTEVDLPTDARKRVWLYGRIEREDVSKFEVTFQGRGFKPLRGEGVLQTAEAQTRIVLTISDSDEKLTHLTGLRGPGLALPDEGQSAAMPQGGPGARNPNLNLNTVPLRPLGAPHELVPSRWIGLETADLVILQDFPHTALTPVQVAALRGYAASGGALLALGGANWQRLSTSPLAELWPVVPQSSGTASTGEVSTLVDRFARFPNMTGADRLGGAPVVATRGELRPGSRVLLGQRSAPLLAVNDCGAGQVLFLAVDPTQPPFIGWRGHARLWADIFRPATRPAQIATTGESDFGEDPNQYQYGYEPVAASLSDGLLDALKTSKQLKTPPVSAIAWFLALYLFFLVPVNYVVLRYFDRRELAWLTIPLIVLTFSVVSYGAALRIKGTAILTRQVNIVQTSDSSPLARADSMLWLFSPRKTTYDISSKDPQMVVGDYVSDRNTSVSIREPEENQAFALEDAPINMWDWRSFVGHSVADIQGGVQVVMQDGRPGVRNSSPVDLKGTVLVSHGRLWGFRTVKAGSTSFEGGRADKASRADAQLQGRIRQASRLEEELPRVGVGGFETIPDKLLSTALASQWSTPSTYLVAWSDRPVASLTIGREDARAQNLTLLVVRVEDDAAIRAALAKESASTPGAKVRRLSVEAVPVAEGKQAGSVFTYEAELARAHEQVSLAVKLSQDTRYGYGSAQAPNTSRPATMEIFNYASGTWRSIPLRDPEMEKTVAKIKADAAKVGKVRPSAPPVPNGAPPPPLEPPDAAAPGQPLPGIDKWNLRTTLSPSMTRSALQQPDNRLLVRVRTYHDDIRVSEVLVQGR